MTEAQIGRIAKAMAEASGHALWTGTVEMVFTERARAIVAALNVIRDIEGEARQ